MEHTNWYTLLFCVWVCDVYITQVKQPVEWFGEEFELFVPCLSASVTSNPPYYPSLYLLSIHLPPPLVPSIRFLIQEFSSGVTYHDIRNNQNRQPHIIRHITPLPEACYGTNPVFSVDEAETAAFARRGAALTLLRKTG